MTGFSQSALLQALGWATLNSFWQVGLMWCGFVLLRKWFDLAPSRQYQVAVISLLVALLSFIGSFALFFSGRIPLAGPVALNQMVDKHWFNYILISSSLAYLILLVVPTYRLWQNWRFLRKLRRSQLAKAPVAYRLYVQKISWHLGIRKPVRVLFSALVKSPVTIGYLKPLVLLPIASFNQLTVQQTEAILLHELAHIRRCDFLINIAISAVHTLLYFNPFVRLFVRMAESSRETCCDQMVLQFGYDPLAYAGALLQLEQETAQLPKLVLAATGKNSFLSRIEVIVGLPPQLPTLKLRHFTGMLASLVGIFVVHSFVVHAPKLSNHKVSGSFTELANPFAMVLPTNEYSGEKQAHRKSIEPVITHRRSINHPVPPSPPVQQNELPEPPPLIVEVNQALDPMEILDVEEQALVTQTVAATRQVLAELQSKAIESNIADALSAQEKAAVHRKYRQDLDALNWERVETNLASRYHQTDWEGIYRKLYTTALRLQADSSWAVYNQVTDTSELMKAGHLMETNTKEASQKESKPLSTQKKYTKDTAIIYHYRPIISL